MPSIPTVYSSTQLTYSIAQISAETQSAQIATSSNIVAGLTSGSDELDANIQKVQNLLALARHLTEQAMASGNGPTLLAPDSASAATLCAQLQSMGIGDLPPQTCLVLETVQDGTTEAIWMTPQEVAALGKTHSVVGTTVWTNIGSAAKPRSLMPTDSGTATTQSLSFAGIGYFGYVMNQITNRLVQPSQLIEWANVATQQATLLTPQLESGNAALQGHLTKYAEAVASASDSQEISDRFLTDRSDSQLQVNMDYRTAVRDIAEKPNRSGTKTPA